MATAITIDDEKTPETNNEDLDKKEDATDEKKTNEDDEEGNDVDSSEHDDEKNPDEVFIPETPELLSIDHMRLCKHSFDKLCKEHSTAIGKALSKRQRDLEKLRGIHLAYSEIRFESFEPRGLALVIGMKK